MIQKHEIQFILLSDLLKLFSEKDKERILNNCQKNYSYGGNTHSIVKLYWITENDMDQICIKNDLDDDALVDLEN